MSGKCTVASRVRRLASLPQPKRREWSAVTTPSMWESLFEPDRRGCRMVYWERLIDAGAALAGRVGALSMLRIYTSRRLIIEPLLRVGRSSLRSPLSLCSSRRLSRRSGCRAAILLLFVSEDLH